MSERRPVSAAPRPRRRIVPWLIVILVVALIAWLVLRPMGAGKGRSGALDSERGVLRRQVPEWLGLPEFRSLVVGFEEASIGHGGAGALYVRLRRAR